MGKPPAFQMYAADFDMDTGSWTCPQVGVYVRLLLYSWVNGSIPNNMAELSRIARTDTRTLAKMWKGTLAKKWKLTSENMYVNQRLELEREKQAKYSESQKQKGIKRSEKMWDGHIAVAKKRLQPKDSTSSSTSSSIKEKNIKQVKEKYLDTVYLTSEEHQKLIVKYGSLTTEKAIEILNNGIMAKGYNYKSHYHALIGWPMRMATGGDNGKGAYTSRTDIRGNAAPDEAERINVEYYAKKAAKEAAANKAGGTPKADDVKDFQGI